MLDRKISPRTSHAGHYFVRDQENAIPPAGLGHTLQVTGWRHGGAQGRPAHWFDDECSHFSIRGLNRPLQLGSVFLTAVAAAVGAIERAAITIRKSHMREFPDHRKIDLAPPLVSGNRQSP